MANHKTIVSIDRCIFARFYYRDKFQRYKRKHLPATPTFDNEPIEYGDQLERLQKAGMVDEWIPTVELHYSASQVVTLTGARSLTIWKAWCDKQFNERIKQHELPLSR